MAGRTTGLPKFLELYNSYTNIGYHSLFPFQATMFGIVMVSIICPRPTLLMLLFVVN